MIIEAVVSTGKVPNFAPMGVEFHKNEVLIRPYRFTDTCKNLIETKCGVVNITDNVLIFAKSALQDFVFPHFRARKIEGFVLEDACRWYEFVVREFHEEGGRVKFFGTIIHEERIRDFLGFNRGKHAVIEATILATRLSTLKTNIVKEEIGKLKRIVEKTGGTCEREAMDYVVEYIEDQK